MSLNEGQKKQVADWIQQGLKLADIQKKLAAELGVTMTYMEVRFLMDDLKLMPKDVLPPAKPKEIAPTPPAETPVDQPIGTSAEGELAPGGAQVSLTVDKLAHPGALVSGQVTFSDGKTAKWYLDQAGRLGLAAQEKGYRPSEEDLAEFQVLLQHELQKFGY